MLNYQNGQHYFNLAEQERNNKNFENAISNYSTSLNCLKDINENYLKPQAIFGRAKSYFMLKQYENVIIDLTDELVSNKINNEFVNYRAYSYLILGHFTKAEKDFNKVLVTEPENIFALRWRGELYLKTWQLNKAIADFEKYIEIYNATEEVLNNLHFIKSYQDEYERIIQRTIEENTFDYLPQVGEKHPNVELKEVHHYSGKENILPYPENQFNFINKEDLQIQERMYQHSSIITSIYISDDSQFILSGDKQGNVILWNVHRHNKVFTFNIGSQVSKLRISSNNRYFASIDFSSRIHIWDNLTKKLLMVIEKEKWIDDLIDDSYYWMNIEFSPDSQNLCLTRSQFSIVDIANEAYMSIVNLETLLMTRFNTRRFREDYGFLTGVHYLNNEVVGLEFGGFCDIKRTLLLLEASTGMINSVKHPEMCVDADFIVTRNKKLIMNFHSSSYGYDGDDPQGDYIDLLISRTENQEVLIKKVLFDSDIYPTSLTAFGESAFGMSINSPGIITLINLEESNIEFYYCPVKLSIETDKRLNTSFVRFPTTVNCLEISPSGDFGILNIDESIYYLDLKDR